MNGSTADGRRSNGTKIPKLAGGTPRWFNQTTMNRRRQASGETHWLKNTCERSENELIKKSVISS